MTDATRLDRRVRRQLALYAAALLALAVLGVFLHSAYTVERAFDVFVRADLQALTRELRDHPDAELPRFHTYSLWRDYDALPAEVRAAFGEHAPADGETRSVERETPAQTWVLARVDDARGRPLYMLNRYDTVQFDRILARQALATLWSALLVAGLGFALLFWLGRWLLRRTSEPLHLLSQWADSLSRAPAQARAPDFPIDELNRLAAQLLDGADAVRAHNDREQQFLRHASHELRTPVAILQASLDVIEMQAPPAGQAAVARAQRANERMTQLINALLMLARDPQRDPPPQPVDLGDAVAQAVADHATLLERRGLQLECRVEPTTLRVEPTLLSIVLANLLRNACSHGAAGTATLRADAAGLRLDNPVEAVADDQAVDGAGLGLELVQRLCERLGWGFSWERRDGVASARIRWGVSAAP